MYFDFEDYRPDTPRIPVAVSLREGILVSVIAHLVLVIVYLLVPESWYERPVEAELLPAEAQAQQQPPLRFVEVMPLVDRMERPIAPADQSDMDRRSSTIERVPDAENDAPRMRGNTPEMMEGGPRMPPSPPPAPPPSPTRPEEPQQMADASALPTDLGLPAPSQRANAPAASSTTPLGESLRDFQRYLREQNFDNPRGGNTQQSADIQFDSMGIDFGPWLRRFKNQVERNWLVPAAAMTFRGRVVIRFNVLRNGTIRDLEVLQPAPIPALTNAALNSLRLSNPTAALPPEYPAEKVLFTVTFHYNEDPRSYP